MIYTKIYFREFIVCSMLPYLPIPMGDLLPPAYFFLKKGQVNLKLTTERLAFLQLVKHFFSFVYLGSYLILKCSTYQLPSSFISTFSRDESGWVLGFKKLVQVKVGSSFLSILHVQLVTNQQNLFLKITSGYSGY